MALEMPVVWSDRHRLHEPRGEIWVGVHTPGTELPERADRIRETLAEAGARFVDAQPQPDDAALAVHDAELLGYLAGAWEEWKAAGLTDDPGQDRVVPYIFPHPGLVGGVPSRRADAASARAGQFACDTMTLIGPGTWEAARAALDAAVTAADLVLGGEPAAYALCRPPGHHVTRTAFGGSCYLNNTAAAAAHLRAALDGPVAVIDIDAHHGNGAQSIFYEDLGILTGSVHVDPAAGWFPHFLGYADETGAGEGQGTNRNVPLAPGSGDERWLEAIAELTGRAREAGARALVVALGVDAAGGDPESPLNVTPAGFHAAGHALGALGLPTVVVQEGGYDLDAIGPLVLETLSGLEDGLPTMPFWK
jgi:acetoin utilization deacetylase AcuC-like enzyme